MKKLVSNLILISMMLGLALGLVSCGEDENDLVSYAEAGIYFKLPGYMEEYNVPAAQADKCYGDRDNLEEGVEFSIYYYTKQTLMTTLFLSGDSTVKEYADWFVAANSYEMEIEEDYQETEQKITLKYYYEPEDIFFYDFILRDNLILVHVTMLCDNDYREKWEPIFDEWKSYISLIT